MNSKFITTQFYGPILNEPKKFLQSTDMAHHGLDITHTLAGMLNSAWSRFAVVRSSDRLRSRQGVELFCCERTVLK